MEQKRASGSCRRAEPARETQRRGCGGFTLIEVLVILALLAGLIAIAFPEFARLYARVRLTFERDEIERQLFELPQAVREAGRGAVLADPAGQVPGPGAAAAADGSVYPEDWRRLSLDLPRGWSMRMAKPIVYHFTGACDGGEIVFSLPPFSVRYVLSAPLCLPRRADAASP